MVAAALLVAVALVVASASLPTVGHSVRVWAGAGVIVAVPAGGALRAVALGWRRRALPARLLIQNGAYVVPLRWTYGLFVAGLLVPVGALVGLTAYDRSHPEVPGYGRPDGAVLIMCGSLVVFVVPVLVRVLGARPAILLTPDGLEARGALAGRTFPWEAMVPWAAVGGNNLGTLLLPVVRPDLVVRRRLDKRGMGISLVYADVHPRFLADAVQVYLLHPERRAEIGTPDGYGHLLADLGVSAPPKLVVGRT